MNIAFESELMENQKHAVVMAPALAFEVLQSRDGDALFFSIGTDNVFYLTREVTQTSTGWNKIDLSSTLSAQHGGKVAAKLFSVTQNAQTLGIDLALVLTVGDTDYLYLSLGNANIDVSWASGVKWTPIPFDAGTAPKPLTIADVYLMNIPADGGAAENIFVDILREPGDPLKLLDRYYITPGGKPQWNLHKLAADLAAGSISSCLGQRTSDPVSGIYTFGTIANERELLFTPQYNYFRPDAPPNPVRLTAPAGASAIASALNSSGASNLFVAGTNGLFLFAPDNQGDGATPVQVVSNGLIAGASELAAATGADRTAVWGVNAQGNLFYVMCPAGRETDPGAWSVPVPLVPRAEGFAFFLNLGAGNNVLFAHVDGQDLIQLTQDPVTTDWLQRSVLLPSTSPSDMAVYKSFTTHIQVTDDNNAAVPNAAVAITATSPVSVYLNDVYYLLSPTVPINTTTDITGVLTVVQETQSLAGVCFRVALTGAPGGAADINPMSTALAKLSAVQSGADLGAVQVTNSDGTKQPLVPKGVSDDDKDAAAKSVAQFVKINAGLPQNGARQAPTSAARFTAAAGPTAAPPKVWGMSFGPGGLKYHEGEEAHRHVGLYVVAPGVGAHFASAGSDLKVAAGDFFRWLKDAWDKVTGFVVQEAEGLYHFLAKIGDKVYDVLLDCIDAVVHAVEFVFNKIKVFFEDLIKWLGFLFEWPDIVRTHSVLKNVFNRYMDKCIDSMHSARAELQKSFTEVVKYIDSWAGIADNIPPSLSGSTLDGSTKSSPPAPGQNSPQSNWALHHLKSNAANGSTNAEPNKGVLGDVLAVLKPLIDAVEREGEILKATYDNFKSDVIDKIHQLSFPQLIKAIVAIIADALVESIENVLLTAIDVLIALVEGITDTLNATIDIPVISPVYKLVADADLSLLDLTCLVAAVPVTVIYKAITDSAPFPDNSTTHALIKAPDFASLQRIVQPAPHGVRLAADATIPTSVNKVLVLTGGIASAVGAVSLSIFQPFAKKWPDIKVFPVINGLSYLLYVAPDIFGQLPDLQNKKWWAIMNEIITDVMVVKAVVDMGVGIKNPAKETALAKWPKYVSPWIDFGANILWQVPTEAALFDPENQNTPGILSMWAGTCFDCNGVMSPAIALEDDARIWVPLAFVAAGFNLAYGAMSCAASVLTFKSS